MSFVCDATLMRRRQSGGLEHNGPGIHIRRFSLRMSFMLIPAPLFCPAANRHIFKMDSVLGDSVTPRRDYVPVKTKTSIRKMSHCHSRDVILSLLCM